MTFTYQSYQNTDTVKDGLDAQHRLETGQGFHIVGCHIGLDSLVNLHILGNRKEQVLCLVVLHLGEERLGNVEVKGPGQRAHIQNDITVLAQITFSHLTAHVGNPLFPTLRSVYRNLGEGEFVFLLQGFQFLDIILIEFPVLIMVATVGEIEGEAIQLQAFHVFKQQSQRIVHTGVKTLSLHEQNLLLGIVAVELLAEFGELILSVVFNV